MFAMLFPIIAIVSLLRIGNSTAAGQIEAKHRPDGGEWQGQWRRDLAPGRQLGTIFRGKARDKILGRDRTEHIRHKRTHNAIDAVNDGLIELKLR